MNRCTQGRLSPLAAALWIAGGLSGCGAGTAAAISGSGDGGSGTTNTAPVLSSFRVEDPKQPPARLSFVLADRESDPATVELFYAVAGGAPQPLSQVAGVSGNAVALATSASGVSHVLDWEFDGEAGLPPDASFLDGVTVYATVRGGIQEVVPGANAQQLGLGNDAPEIAQAVAPGTEVDGIAAVRFRVQDSSRDLVGIAVEYHVDGDLPDLGWRTARPAGIPPEAPTPELAFAGVEAPAAGVDLVFFWDTDVDLADLDHDVRLRLTPRDDVALGEPAETGVFRVDNNEEPVAFLDSGLLIADSDQRRGIPIPYRIVDEEGDPVDVVLQWRRTGEAFPELPRDRSQIAAALADPVRRRALHACSPFAAFAGGLVDPLDASSVRLPELAKGALHLAAGGLEGRAVEILRGPAPRRAAASWVSNPLHRPVAALPIGDGLAALVLDSPAAGGWRLREIELATGRVSREVASGASGDPSAMAFELERRSVLVASDVAGAWEVAQVDLASGTVVPRIAASAPQGSVRGIASCGAGAALVTVASSLVRVDWSGPSTPKAVAIFDDLATPWGIVSDPLDRDHVYLAEHDAPMPGGLAAGRVLAIDLARRARSPLTAAIGLPDENGLPGPEALAIDRGGSRLLVVSDTDPFFGQKALLACELGRSSGAIIALSNDLAPQTGSLAAGPDGLLLVALTSADDLAIGGGVSERRAITGYDPARQIATVSPAFDRPPEPLQRWRIAEDRRPRTGDAGGGTGVIVWDSADVPSAGDVFFRATPIDTEVGLPGETAAPKRIRNDYAADALVLPAGALAWSATPADLDGDGDLDLAAASIDGLMVFRQVGPGAFDPNPLLLSGANTRDVVAADVDLDGDRDLVAVFVDIDKVGVFLQTSPGVFAVPTLLGDPAVSLPQTVQAADLDGDGDLDVAAGYGATNNLAIFFQGSPGTFTSPPLVLGGGGATQGPNDIAAADLDGDGDLDLASCNQQSGELAVFFQESPGSFGPTPVVLGAPGILNFPWSIVAADVDEDGDQDLVSANLDPPGPALFLQTEPGTFDLRPAAFGAAGHASYGTEAADMDGDGHVDIVCSDVIESRLAIYHQDGEGAFDPVPTEIGDPTSVGASFSIEAADLDGDGALDLVAAYQSLAIFLQEPRGTLQSSPAIDTSILEAADQDGDGDLDLLSLTRIHRQTSPGVFQAIPLAIPSAKLFDLEDAADLDGDGRLDLVLSAYANDTVSIYFQDAAGALDPTPVILGDATAPDGQTIVETGDMDGDGDLDLILSSHAYDNLSIFFQIGPRAFDPKPLVLGGSLTTDGPLTVVPADLDGDGDLDLVSASTIRNILTVFFQTAPGTFNPTPLVLGSSFVTLQPVDVVAADLDQDGDLDLASANVVGNDVTIFFQIAPGSFSSPPLTLGASSPGTLVAADVDGDGDQDLAVGLSGTDLALFLQERPGVFSPAVSILGAGGAVDVADVDGDGDPDIVTQRRVMWGGR